MSGYVSNRPSREPHAGHEAYQGYSGRSSDGPAFFEQNINNARGSATYAGLGGIPGEHAKKVEDILGGLETSWSGQDVSLPQGTADMILNGNLPADQVARMLENAGVPNMNTIADELAQLAKEDPAAYQTAANHLNAFAKDIASRAKSSEDRYQAANTSPLKKDIAGGAPKTAADALKRTPPSGGGIPSNPFV